MRPNAIPFLVSAALYRMDHFPANLPEEPNGFLLPGNFPPGWTPPLEIGEQPDMPDDEPWPSA